MAVTDVIMLFIRVTTGAFDFEPTCEIHDLARNFHSLPDGEVGEDPRKEECAEERPDHGAHLVDAVSDLKDAAAARGK